MTFCPKCGNNNQNDGRFCSVCGEPLPSVSQNEKNSDCAENVNDGNISLSGTFTENKGNAGIGCDQKKHIADQELSILSEDINNMGIMLISFVVMCFIPYINTLAFILLLVILCMTRWSLASRTADFFRRRELLQYVTFAQTGHTLSLRILIMYVILILLGFICGGTFVVGMVFHKLWLVVTGFVFFELTMVLSIINSFMTLNILNCFLKVRTVIEHLKNGLNGEPDVSTNVLVKVLYVFYSLTAVLCMILMIALICIGIVHWDSVRESIMQIDYSKLNQTM
jgi:hypothetical protein